MLLAQPSYHVGVFFQYRTMTVKDIFELLKQGRIEEATKIYQALQRVLPNIDDRDGKCAAFMQYASSRLDGLRKISDSAVKGEPNVGLDQLRDENHGSSLTNGLDSKMEDAVSTPDPQNNFCDIRDFRVPEEKATICVPPNLQRLLDILKGSMSVKEMMAALNFHSRDKFLKNNFPSKRVQSHACMGYVEREESQRS